MFKVAVMPPGFFHKFSYIVQAACSTAKSQARKYQWITVYHCFSIIRKQHAMKTHVISHRFHLQPIPDFPARLKRVWKYKIIRRLTPFLILSVVLLFLFAWTYISGYESVQGIWQKILLFCFLQANMLYADFALWNYFKGRQLFRIWFIEGAVSQFIIYLLIWLPASAGNPCPVAAYA